MNVSNTAWQLAGVGSDPVLILQNVGDTRIAYFIGTALPQSDDENAANYVALETGDHGILYTGLNPTTIASLDDSLENFYVRSLGPKSGLLYVNAN